MLNRTAFATRRALLFAVMALCLVFAQALEVQHDHQQLSADCYLCQQSSALACSDEKPQLQAPEHGTWLETSPYHRLHRNLEKRGKRDPPQSHEISA